jgi:Leucine-rich repeat (LRR) protein
MDNTGLAEIEPHFLQATGLYRLEVSHNPLFDIADEAFSGLERSLWELVLKDNGIVKVPTKALRYLQKLRYLDLSGNQIRVVERDSFRGLQNNLQTLILADNSITELSIESFQGLPNLNTLDLSSNNLREILPDVFREQMNSLITVNFADNLLSEIPYFPLSMLRSLRFLDLSQNRITNFLITNHDGSPLNIKLTLEELHLEHNQLHTIPPASFQYFLVSNATYLDFNPIHAINDNAFQSARIRELYVRHCRLDFIEPSAFSGLENSLQVLDMSGNNITTLPDNLFNSFDLLQSLNVKENKILSIFPHSATFTSFHYSLLKLDLTGDKNGPTNISELKRLKKLRSLSVGKLQSNQLTAEDFQDFGHELENLKIFHAGLKTIKARAFMNTTGIKRLDLSENSIDNIEKGAFTEIGHSLISFRAARAFSTTVNQLPDMRELTSLEELDVSNNKLKSIGETAFHSMKQLRVLRANDNLLEQIPKGLFQREIHRKLEEIVLDFNAIRHIATHTFVDLEVRFNVARGCMRSI